LVFCLCYPCPGVVHDEQRRWLGKRQGRTAEPV
jgi:hypothetical protein